MTYEEYRAQLDKALEEVDWSLTTDEWGKLHEEFYRRTAAR